MPEVVNYLNHETWDGWPLSANWNGINFCRSEICVGNVRDGLTCTYMVGEKYLSPDYYADATLCPGDDDGAYMGVNGDANRRSSIGCAPWRDQPGYDSSDAWGSVHPDAFNMVMCDGSVRPISYSIDPEIHRRLGDRADGESIEDDKF